MPSTTAPYMVAEYAEELYFYLFHISQKSQRLSIFKLSMNICFVVVLMAKFGRYYDTIPWLLVFSCPLLVNVIMFCMEINDAFFLSNSSEAHLRLVKPIATLLDISGSLYFKIMLLLWVTQGKFPQYITVWLAGTWLFWIASTILRCLIARKRLPYEIIMRHKIASYISAFIYFMFRVFQLFLIVLRIDGIITSSWFIIFSPSFALTFLGLGCSLLLYSVLPCVHYNADRQLRETARYLTQLIAFCLFLAGSAGIVFLVNLCQVIDKQDFKYKDISRQAYKLAAPLLVIYVVYLGAIAAFYHLYKDYQQQLSGRVLQRLARPATSGRFVSLLSSEGGTQGKIRWDNLKYHKSTNWLIKTAGSVYTAATKLTKPSVDECASLFKRKRTSCQENSTADGLELNMSALEDGDLEMCNISRERERDCDDSDSASQPLTITLETSATGATSPTLSTVERCIVCFSKAVSVVLVECGHAATCLTCTVAIAQSAQLAHCPLCRQSFSGMYDIPLGNRYTYNYQVVPSELSSDEAAVGAVVNYKTDCSPTKGHSTIIASEIIRSDWQYSFARPNNHLEGNDNTVNNEIAPPITAADMNNAMAIGNTVNTLAAINTISYHYSLIDILI